ncbi:T9SS type A sorting domain-containing protein, partial [Flavivirga algicola]
CLVWHLSFDGDLEGAETGKNASDLVGCYSLSNPIEVIRNDKVEPVCDVNGGYIKAGGLYLFCEGDGNDDFATGIKLHNNEGYSSQWVVTDVEGNILGLPPSPDAVNFDGAGPGVCLIWHLSFNTIYGAEEGNNAFTDLSGCYDLSNPIPVFRFPSDSAVCDLINYANHHKSKSAKISMHPNPARNNLKIDLSGVEDEDVTVKIYNFSSREVINKSVNLAKHNKTINVNVSSLPQGLYLVSITNKDNSIKTVKRLLVE